MNHIQYISIPWFYSDSWNIPRPMNPSIGPSSRGRTQFLSERWNSPGTDHPHHQVQHSSPNASSPRVETLFLDPCCFFCEGKLIHSFWCNVFLIQASYSVNMQLGQETHIVLEDIANANKNAWFMIPDPRSITPDPAYQPQPQKPEKHVKDVGQENVKRFSDGLILAVLSLSLSLSPPYLKYVSYMKPLWNPPRVNYQIQSQPKSNQKEARKSIPYAANMKLVYSIIYLSAFGWFFMVNLGHSTIPYIDPYGIYGFIPPQKKRRQRFLETTDRPLPPNLGHKGLLANSFLERTKVQGINEAKTDGYTNKKHYQERLW